MSPKTGQRLRLLLMGITLIIFLFSGHYQTLIAQSAGNSDRPAVDPFYLKVFNEAKSAFQQGNYQQAFENFKIAAFGMLDEPDLLGQTYVYLAVAADQLGKDDQVEHYLQQISHFKLLRQITASSLPEEVKDRFKQICGSYKILISG
ncbi:MAG: hypothetical protein PHU81_05680 [Acidobacteriota bacterium]|nr:hypothetical protein [Acidobacteriota bacterium]